MAEFIKELFENKISRRIEEVIKVDRNDEGIISDEIKEYVVTNSIRDYYNDILEHYRETPNKPHEGVGVWVSGFFGSGKSSFAKMLGLALENRLIQGERAATFCAWSKRRWKEARLSASRRACAANNRRRRRALSEHRVRCANCSITSR